MKKLFLITVLILFTNALLAQDKIVQVNYEIVYNISHLNIKNDTLYFDVSKKLSVYKKNSPLKKDGDEPFKKEDFVKNKKDETAPSGYDKRIIGISLGSAKQQGYNYFDFNKDSLFSLEDVLGDNYLVAEKIPEIKWQLTGEEKMIDKYKVLKATCRFRGRNYTAWYSPDFPFKYGPWKFGGLPGLIFEIQDETHTYNWQIKSIAYVNNPGNIFEGYAHVAGVPTINLREYAAKLDDTKALDEKVRASTPMQPRGAILVISKTLPQRRMELKFEWEE